MSKLHKKKNMKFEDLLLEIDGFGKFQILILFILCLPRMNLPMHFLLHNFLAATPSHHCAIPHQEAFVNLTMEEVLLISIPREPDGTFKSCEMFSQGVKRQLGTKRHFGLVFQWDLVCEQRGLNQATATFFFIGVTMGAVVFGYLSDRRRPGTLPRFALVKKPCRPPPGEVLCVPPERCLLLTGMEWVDVEHRTFSGILTSMFWSVGNMLLAAVAYLVREWRWLLVAVTGPCLLTGRLVGMGAGCDLPPLPCERGKSCNADPRIGSSNPKRSGTRLCLALGLPRGGSSNEPTPSPHTPCRFGVAFSYYGMSMNLTGFGLNMYLSQFVFGFIEIPAKMIMYVLVNRVGRRQSQAWALILTGLCIGANIVIPKRKILFLAIMGKGFSEAAFTTAFLYTCELYPTVLSSFMARLGGALAPLVFLLDEVWRSLPEVTYCGVAVCCGLVAFLLPETLHVRLPEGIEDIEKTQDSPVGIGAVGLLALLSISPNVPSFLPE
uniref:Solute carrier family 22 member 7 n=1 Tax=Aquila chrysaetos chrysaetos TaxID=223781 RepID=A0A663FBI8_AQUCH